MVEKTTMRPHDVLQVPDYVPYCTLLFSHAKGASFEVEAMSQQQSNCLGIGIEGFNKKSIDAKIIGILDEIVSYDSDFFNYTADTIKMEYSQMHPLRFWNTTDHQ